MGRFQFLYTGQFLKVNQSLSSLNIVDNHMGSFEMHTARGPYQISLARCDTGITYELCLAHLAGKKSNAYALRLLKGNRHTCTS